MINGIYKFLSKLVPIERALPLIAHVVLNCIVYAGTSFLTRNWKHYDFTTDFDRMVPVIPWFIYIYFGCYAFWVLNYILVGRHTDKDTFYKFITLNLSTMLICGILFLVIPTTNVRPEIVGDSFSDRLLRFCYAVDRPSNLFPSLHCLTSWYCFLGIRHVKKIPFSYKIFSFLFAITIMVSTQVTKQHYIVDVIGAIAISEFLVVVVKHTNYYKYVMNFFEAWNRRIADWAAKKTGRGSF